MQEEKRKRRMDRLVGRVEKKLPSRATRAFQWITSPAGMFVRIPVGLLLMIGGLLSFLPLLGIWMLPLGILLIAIDVPVAARAVVAVWPKIERRGQRYKRQRQARSKVAETDNGAKGPPNA